MNDRECETCIKKKTVYCPNSCKCYETETKPYYQNRIMLLEENQKLKKQLKEQDYTSVYLKGCTDTKDKYLSQQKEFIKCLEKLAHQDTVPSDFANGCKVAYGIALSKYKEIIGGDNK